MISLMPDIAITCFRCIRPNTKQNILSLLCQRLCLIKGIRISLTDQNQICRHDQYHFFFGKNRTRLEYRRCRTKCLRLHNDLVGDPLEPVHLPFNNLLIFLIGNDDKLITKRNITDNGLLEQRIILVQI